MLKVVQRLGEVLRERRTDLNLTQTELATTAGVSVRFVRDVENGKDTAQVGLVIRVLDALGLRLVLARNPDIPAPTMTDLDP